MKKSYCSGSSLVLSVVLATGLASAQSTPGGSAANPAAVGASAQPAVDPNPTTDPAPPPAAATAPNAVDPQTVRAATAAEVPPSSSATVAANDAPLGNAAAAADTKADRGKKKNGDGAQGKDDDEEQDAKLPWEVKPKIRIGGLLHSQFSINDAQDSADYDFRLTNARIVLEWQQGSLLDAVGEVELSRDGDREATSWAPMRDAFVRVSPHKALRLRMGQFKRPFGKLALTSLRELKLIRRGISDVWVNEELEFGERDVGFQVDGQVGKGYELHYAFGAFNGPGRNRRDNDPNGAKDFVGRIEGRMGKILSIGFNSANKRFDQSAHPDRPKSAWMSGADVLVEYAGFYGLVEAQYGSNYLSIDRYHTGSLLALVAYKIPITPTWQIAVEPLIKGEVLKVETEVRDRQILNGTAGANLYVGRIFRLMVQGEWIRPKGPLPENLGEAIEEKRLIFQAGMYTR